MKRGVELLRMPIVEAQRLDTVMEFDVFKRFCMTVLRRENAVLGPTVRKYMEVDRKNQIFFCLQFFCLQFSIFNLDLREKSAAHCALVRPCQRAIWQVNAGSD